MKGILRDVTAAGEGENNAGKPSDGAALHNTQRGELPEGCVLLHTLPQGHPLRSAPLLGAQCRNLLCKEWRDIGPSWAIAKASFDQLGEAWTCTTEFRRALN